MSLTLAPDHEILFNDCEILAVRQEGVVEVWTSDGEFLYGTIAGNSTVEDVRTVVNFYLHGYAEGRKDGREQIQSAIRSLMGLNS